MTSTDSDDLDKSITGLEPVKLNVYFIRNIAFDEDGRVVRTSRSKLTWSKKLVKDILGIYHTSLCVHGTEFTFGNYHAPNSRLLGGEHSGVVAHDPERSGPKYVLKDSISLGGTALSAAQVEEAAAQLGLEGYPRTSYNRVRHNCVDFCTELGEKIGADELPMWCQRAATVGKTLGVGVDAVAAAATRAVTLNGTVKCPQCRAPQKMTEPEETIEPEDHFFKRSF
jgi:hypothetical protein